MRPAAALGAPERDRRSATFVYAEQDGVRRSLGDASAEAVSEAVDAGQVHMVIADTVPDKSDMSMIMHIIPRP